MVSLCIRIPYKPCTLLNWHLTKSSMYPTNVVICWNLLHMLKRLSIPFRTSLPACHSEPWYVQSSSHWHGYQTRSCSTATGHPSCWSWWWSWCWPTTRNPTDGHLRDSTPQGSSAPGSGSVLDSGQYTSWPIHPLWTQMLAVQITCPWWLSGWSWSRSSYWSRAQSWSWPSMTLCAGSWVWMQPSYGSKRRILPTKTNSKLLWLPNPWPTQPSGSTSLLWLMLSSQPVGSNGLHFTKKSFNLERELSLMAMGAAILKYLASTKRKLMVAILLECTTMQQFKKSDDVWVSNFPSLKG